MIFIVIFSITLMLYTKEMTMLNNRYQKELMVLNENLAPNQFRFLEMGTSNEHLVMAVRTNRRNIYTLYIQLDGFPENMPKVFVTQMLVSHDGKKLESASGTMHTLTSENGWTRICHYGSNSWTPNVSLYKVYIKCRLWLEMYELHLQTGKPIDYYLSHQQ